MMPYTDIKNTNSCAFSDRVNPVTGATGYIRKRLLPFLVEKGQTFIFSVSDINRLNTPKSHKSNIEAMIKHPYYDSKRKKRSDESSFKAIIFSFIGVIILIICEN